MEWKKIPVPLSELCLSSVLRCGQSFRWKSSGNDEWSCALSGRILSLKQDSTHLYYHAIFPSPAAIKGEGDNIKRGQHIKYENGIAIDDTAELIRDYFNLSVNLTELYEKWSSRDPHFKKKAPAFTGIRILRQDPWENLVSFICSSNNNISRIGQMVENLCITFGESLGQLGGTSYYDFPPPSKLTPASVEGKLRELGFGYRAKYIHQTTQVVAAHGEDWLRGLRHVPYQEAHAALLELQGVGPKVADCVCLMSLDKKESVPVDTHVWQIAMRDYKFGKGKHKSLTKATYLAIGDHFRDLWGEEAGWAHSVLFAADLKTFAVKEVKVEKSTTKTLKWGIKDKELGSNSSGEGLPSTSNSIAAKKKLSRRVQAEVKDEDGTDTEETARKVKLEARVKDQDNGGNEIDTETTNATNDVKREDGQVIDTDIVRRSKRRVKVEARNEGHTDQAANTVIKRASRRNLKVEVKREDDVKEEEEEEEEEEGGGEERAVRKERSAKERFTVNKEKATKRGGKAVKEEAGSSSKRTSRAEGGGQELDIKLEGLGAGLTMADRIKRRRRR